jgi:trimethylamine:corrinoid methyltransferase-like protein
MSGECDPERCLAEVLEATGGSTFAGLDSTRDNWREVYWQPRFFERRSLAAWRAAGRSSIRGHVHDEVRRLIGQHEYALDAGTQAELDRILAVAKQALAW